MFYLLNAIVASLEGTPPYILIIICERLAMPLSVRLYIGPFQHFQKQRVRHRHVAAMLGAHRRNGLLEPFVRFLLQVQFPVLLAELMAAIQGEGGVGGIKHRIADLAHPLVESLRAHAHVGEFFLLSPVVLKAKLQGKLVLLVEPFILDFICIPFEVPEHDDRLVLGETQELSNFVDHLLLPFLDSLHVTHDVRLL